MAVKVDSLGVAEHFLPVTLRLRLLSSNVPDHGASAAAVFSDDLGIPRTPIAATDQRFEVPGSG